ncbi:MAG: ACP S-malonyltransferase [Deinococcales bacterium]
MIAALFPGQGSQSVGMAQDFYDSPAAKTLLDRAEQALPGLLKLMWQGPEEELKLTANQQPALVAAGVAAFAAYLEAGGAMPQFAAGHSLGEFSAHVAAGSLDISEAIPLVHHRGKYMQEAVPAGLGAMAAVMKADKAQILAVCQQVSEGSSIAEIANLNSPDQTVISGEAKAVQAASEVLKGLGARLVPLNVSAPFHCSLMQPAADKLALDLAKINFKPMQIPVLANVTAAPILSEADIAQLLKEQVTSSVRWTELIENLAALGVKTYLEFGSGKVLAGLVKRIIKDKDIMIMSISDKASLAEALSVLGRIG